MPSKLHRFNLKLLTSSKDIGLRRIRSYTASLGGGADIFNDVDKLIESIGKSSTKEIVLLDGTIVPDTPSFNLISSKAEISCIDSTINHNSPSPGATSPYWGVSTYAQTDFKVFLTSPVCRMNAAQMASGNHPLQLANLLRWGHARELWLPEAKNSISTAGQSFIKNFRLVSDWRRSIEMFCHFAETHLKVTGLDIEKIDFASDGLLLASVAKCRVPLDSNIAIRDLVDELRVFKFPIAAINQLEDQMIEIAVYHCPVHSEQKKISNTVLVYKKDCSSKAHSSSEQDNENSTQDLSSPTNKLGRAG